ncbi:MAG: hypothetical protein PUG22_01805 [Peptoniphilaceae bacterium]|nr:hypothetical protein [Peptoniphilaceae bacterium]
MKQLKNNLKNEFVPVKINGKYTYGGRQKDLEKFGVSKFMANRSCVVTAFTNSFLYTYRRGEKFSFEEYNSFQYKFYKILKPWINGIPTAKILDLRVNTLRKKGYKLKSHFLYDTIFKKTTLEEKIEFIEYALNKDIPVILFNWQSKEIDILKNHAVVITKIYKSEDYHIINVSSWGKKYVINFDKFDKQFSLYKGFVYFEREDIMKFIKVETFIPKENVEELINALNEKNIIKIGNYDFVYTTSEVMGHFRALDGSNPYEGEVGKKENVSEIKLEFKIKTEHKRICDEIIREKHPYEEPVINYYELL